MTPAESKYKRYYDFVGNSAKCKKCKHPVLKGDGGSKSMRVHLQCKHKELLSRHMKKFVVSTPADTTSTSPAQPQGKQQSVQQIYGNWSKSGQCTKAAHRALMQLLASANLPLSLVDDPAFRNFCNALQPLYHPPSRRTLSHEHIESLCTEYEEKVKEDLRQARHISLTSDVGTTKNQKHSLVALTAHYVKPDGHLGHCYAGVVPLRVRHTGLAIASVIDDLVNYYDIRDKAHVVLRDNGSSMIKAMEIYGVQSSDCFAHVLQN
ncbi:zinc finger BED domain-containing protein 4-like, partial [Aphelenchoides avenae]